MENLNEAVVVDAPGTIGIGVGRYLEPIASRGEKEPVFQSSIWFPVSCLEEAQECAKVTGLVLKENVTL